MAARYHPEYMKAIEPLLPVLSKIEKPPVHDVESRRAEVEARLGPLFRAEPIPADVEITIHHATAKDGTSIAIYHYRKKDLATQGTQTSLPAVLYSHGGGYIMLDVALYSAVIAGLASATGVQFFAVDYRLAPEHPFPTGPEDCYAGLLWLHEHAAEFNVDRSRIAVMGDSAGGGLAASVALMARDRELSPPLAKQILVYPMLDDRNVKPTPLEPFYFWNVKDNITAWTAYVGKNASGDGVSPYAAPARTESVEGLPSTYIDVGTLDLFRDEDLIYASRLAAANIEIESHLYPGLPHAFELLAKGTDIVNAVMANRVKAITSF